MDEYLKALVEGINRWRSHDIQDYWMRVEYIGAELNRMGDHALTFTGGKLWHQRHGEWRKVETGKDYWLFSVPGGFAWARDLLTKVLPAAESDPDAIELRFNDEYGYVEHLNVKVASRDAANFTLEVKGFGVGVHPAFRE